MTKILVSNRGEIAIRILRAVAELNLGSVVVFSEDDVASLHRHKADHAVVLMATGAAAYLDQQRLVQIQENASTASPSRCLVDLRRAVAPWGSRLAASRNWRRQWYTHWHISRAPWLRFLWRGSPFMTISTLSTSTGVVALPVQDELLYEVVDGQCVAVPPMSAYATWLASRLHGLLWPYTEEQALGTAVTEMLFILDASRDLRRRPDVAFVSAARWPLHQEFPETGDWGVVPDLAVEVLSPNDVVKDVLAKLREYFHYGVQVVWVVSPEEQQVYVYTSPTQVRILTVGDTLTEEQLLPGFRLPLVRLFQRVTTTGVAPTP